MSLCIVAHQALPAMGFPRQGYLIRLYILCGLPFPFPGKLPDPVIKPMSPVSLALQVDSLPTEPSHLCVQSTKTGQLFKCFKIQCKLLSDFVVSKIIYHAKLWFYWRMRAFIWREQELALEEVEITYRVASGWCSTVSLSLWKLRVSVANIYNPRNSKSLGS